MTDKKLGEVEKIIQLEKEFLKKPTNEIATTLKNYFFEDFRNGNQYGKLSKRRVERYNLYLAYGAPKEILEEIGRNPLS